MQKNLTILLIVFLAACTTTASRPVLRIASDATFAPFHLLDKSGAATGFDIELARAVAIQAGFEPEILILAYDDLFTGLGANTHDVVAATTGITPEREKIYLFGQPYFETYQVAVVRTGAAEPTRLSDLRGKRIGASGSGTSMRAMRMLKGDHISLDDGRGVASLGAGKIDAWIVDEFDGVAAARASLGHLRVLPQPVTQERYAFVYAKNRRDLKIRLNESQTELEKNGTVAKLRIQFGVERDSEWPVERAVQIK